MLKSMIIGFMSLSLKAKRNRFIDNIPLSSYELEITREKLAKWITT
jgi:hypothetical protein